MRRTLRHNVQDTNGTVSSLRPSSAKAVVIARSRFATAIKWGAVSIGAPKAREHIHGRRLSKSVLHSYKLNANGRVAGAVQ